MGMYTELVLLCRIKNDPAAVEVLKFMCDEDDVVSQPRDLPKHPLFKTPRWAWMFRSASFYFTPVSVVKFVQDSELHADRSWSLVVRCDLKNYDDEIEHLTDWLQPYLDTEPGGMIGYSRYEEHDDPTILRCLWESVA